MSIELIPHLFRSEYPKIVATICRYAGLSEMSLAEDMASEAFLSALETWPYKGIPENPGGWLQTVARNKAINFLKRSNLHTAVVNDIDHNIAIEAKWPEVTSEIISDSQLKMMFVVCHPALQNESQIALALRILCGFGIEEIASALLSNVETITKRLYRAKKTIRDKNIQLDLPDLSVLPERLENVVTVLYLLFNEGYYSETSETVMQPQLCFESLRLTQLLLEHEVTNLPVTNALIALMFFHSSRFKARIEHNFVPLLSDSGVYEQWDEQYIAKGLYHLHLAATGSEIHRFHLEATIAYWHTQPENESKWKEILGLYDKLLLISPSEIAALNRIYALQKLKGKEVAIEAFSKIKEMDNSFYHSLGGYLYQSVNDEFAKVHFEKALSLARNKYDKLQIERKLSLLK